MSKITELLNVNTYLGYAVLISGSLIAGALGGALADWLRWKLRRH